MKKEDIIIIVLAILFLLFMLYVSATEVEAKAVKQWFISKSLENPGGTSYGGLKYQKTIDEEQGTVCYTAVGAKGDVAISCVTK